MGNNFDNSHENLEISSTQAAPAETGASEQTASAETGAGVQTASAEAGASGQTASAEAGASGQAASAEAGASGQAASAEAGTGGQTASAAPGAGMPYTNPDAGYAPGSPRQVQQDYSSNAQQAKQSYSTNYQQQENYHTNYQQQENYNTNYQQAQQENYNTNYQQAQQAYNTNYQQQYQDNFNYNVGSGMGYGQPSYENDTAPMTMGEWVLVLLLMSIPCVNIILCCVWAFGKSGNVNRRNFCRAQLIFMAVGIVLSIIMVIIFAAAGISMGSYYYY